MPRSRASSRRRTRRPMSGRKSRAVVRKRRMRGGSLWSSLYKFGQRANNWLKKTKAISKAGKVADIFNVPLVPGLARELGQYGYGRKKRTVRRRRRYRKGGSVGLPGSGYKSGGALKLAGRGSKKTMRLKAPPIMY